MSRWRPEDLTPEQRSRIANPWNAPITAASAKAHKYKAKAFWVDNIRFGSTLEAEHYQQLKLLKAAGVIRYFLRQVVFHLPGGTKHVVDWMVVMDGREPLFRESKGYDVPMGRLKRRQVKELFGIDILVWTKQKLELP